MSFSAETSSLRSESEPTSLVLSEDIEVARERTDSELNSEEILCNYGDNVVLDDASEDARSNGTPKPVPERFLSKVRFFVRNRITSKQVAFDKPPNGSQSQSEGEIEFDLDSEDSSFSNSLGPSKSYASLSDYLTGLAEKKQNTGRSCTERHLSVDSSINTAQATGDKSAVGESTEQSEE